jgi:DNA-directed RNA polymerase specialized sigma24 family protein
MADALRLPKLNPQENEWFMRELHPHEPMLRTWLASRFPAMTDFQDLIQEAYVRTVKRHRIKRMATPKPFLFAIARNLRIDSMCRENIVRFEPLVELDPQGLADQESGIPDRIVAKEEYEILASAIHSLPKSAAGFSRSAKFTDCRSGV